MSELVTLWDGAHRNGAWDLLITPYIPAPDVPRPEWEQERIRDARRLLSDCSTIHAQLRSAPASRASLRSSTGLSDTRVDLAVRRLKRLGVVRRAAFGVYECATR